jgi:hypothetical protein
LAFFLASPSTTPKNPLRQTSKIELNRNSHQSNEDYNNQQRNRKRSLFFLEQFPYPLENDFRDDFNQRKIILFGITPKRYDNHKTRGRKLIRQELGSIGLRSENFEPNESAIIVNFSPASTKN